MVVAGQMAPPPIVRCTNPGCPEGVGLWVYQDKVKMPLQCTAFLIGPDELLTNHHCLPPKMQSAGASCEGIRIYFPATGKWSLDSANCSTVQGLSETDSKIDEPDWAVVKLSRPMARQPLEINREGLADRDSVRLWVVSPNWTAMAVRNQPGGEIREQDCRVSRRTQIFHDEGSNSNYLDRHSRRVPLSTCPAWKGNSGAPVLAKDSSGRWQVRALLDRSAPNSTLREFVKLQNWRLLDTNLTDFAYASNIACLPLKGATIPLSCKQDSNPVAIAQDRQKWKQEVDEAIQARIASTPGLKAGLAPRILQAGVWSPFPKVATPRDGRLPDALVVPLPTCGTPTSDSTWKSPLWAVAMGFDRELRWNFRIDDEDSAISISCKCRPLKAARTACRFEARFPKGSFGLGTDTLPECGAIDRGRSVSSR